MARDFAGIAQQYADDVIAGRVKACRQIRRACKRHVDNLASVNRDDYRFFYHPESGIAVCEFAEMLPHVKGEWAGRGETISLEPWQIFMFMILFGWLRKSTGLRRFRKLYLQVPRKNGKSLICSVIGLWFLCMDGEAGAEVFAGAKTEYQAWKVFGPAKTMVDRSPDLAEACGLQALKTRIVESGGGVFQTMIGKPGDGDSPSCAIADEFHEHETPDQVDAMETGMGARAQPLLAVITTAGYNIGGPCFELLRESEKMLDGSVPNDELFALVYTIDLPETHFLEDDATYFRLRMLCTCGNGESLFGTIAGAYAAHDPGCMARKQCKVEDGRLHWNEPGDDWTDPAILAKANPNYGISVDAEYLQSSQRSAVINPAQANRFKTKHLNIWATAKAACFNMPAYNAGADPGMSLQDFKGGECWIILDLASKIDICAVGILFKKRIAGRDHYYYFTLYYLPEDAIEADKKNAANYRKWVNQGLLKTTEGAELSFAVVREDVMALMPDYAVKELVYDPWRATQLAHEFAEKGANVVEYRQIVQLMSPPMKEIQAAILAGRWHHDGNEITTWMFGNTVGQLDAKDNIYPRKERPEYKIDGAVAAIMGVGRAMTQQTEGTIDDFLNQPVYA